MDLQHNNTVMTDDKLRAWFTERLEKNGWRCEIAGEDWEPAIAALTLAAKTKRGVLATGAFGCGKTSMIRAIVNHPVIDLSRRDELDRLDPDGPERGLNYYKFLRTGVLLDDLGAECPRSDYGVKRDMAGEYIVAHHAQGRGRLYITTNLSAEEIANRYGGRVADRLKELCAPLVFKGKSKRKWATQE